MSGPTTTGSIDAKLTVDDSDFKRGMAEAKADAKEVGALEPTVKVDANVGEALAKLDAVAMAEKRLEAAQRSKLNTSGALSLAEMRYEAVMTKSGRTDLQVAAAEEALARARRADITATEKSALATLALNDAKSAAARKSLEEAAADDVQTESTKRSTQANHQRMQGWQVLVALAPALLGPVSAITASAVGLGAAFGVAGVSGVLAIKGIKDAMEVGDSVGNTYATGIQGLKENLNALAGTSANAMLGSFNIAVQDINARMPSLTQMIGEGSAALGKMGDTALRGVLDGLRTMNPLIQAGEVELSKFVTWLFSFNGTSGFHDFIQYAIDNLPATMHLLENLVTVAGHILAAYAPLGPVMLTLLNGLTDALNGLPLPVLAGLVTTATLIGPALRLAFAPGVSALITSVAQAIGYTGVMANLAVPVVGILTAAIAGIGVMAASAALGTSKGTSALRDYTQALKEDSLAIGEHVKAQVAKELVDSGAAEAAQRLGLSLMTVQEAAIGNKTAIEAVKNVTDEASKKIIDWTSGGAYASAQNKQLSGDVDLMRNSVIGASGAVQEQLNKQKLLNEMLHPTTSAMTEQSSAAQALAGQYGVTVAQYQSAQDAQIKAAAATADTTLKMRLQNDAAGLLKMAWDELNGKTISAAQAQNAFDSSLANMGDHVSATGKKIQFTTTSINDMSAASVALRGQLIGQVQNMERVIEADGGLQNATAQSKQKYAEMREQIIANAVSHGVNRDAAEAYIDTIYKVPTAVTTQVEIDTAAANAKLATTKGMLDALRDKTIFIDVQRSDSNVDNTGGAGHVQPVKYNAEGGPVSYLDRGGFPGGPKGTDTVPTWLTPEEFVVKRASAKSIGLGNLDYMNRTGQLPPTAQVQQQGPMVMTGTLVMDSGEVMGTFRGIAQAEASSAVAAAGRDAGRRPTR